MLRIPRLIVLNLTSDCNMRCKYCYAAAGENQDYMSEEIALKIIDEMIRINCGRRVKVLFHGGEPLLCYELIKRIIEYCENYYYGLVDFYIQTNCVLLDDDAISYLASHDVKISISVDGNNAQNNACRILNSGQNSIGCIKKAMQSIANHNVAATALAVLNKNNYTDVEQIIDFFVKNGILSFSFNYFIKGGRGHNNSSLALNDEELFETTKKIINVLEGYHYKGIPANDRNVYFLVNMIATKKKRFMCANSPCGAGLNVIGITPNGDIYPCDDLSGHEYYKLGNIKESDIESILSVKMMDYFALCNLNNIDGCHECTIKDRCGAGCCSRKFYEEGDIYCVDPICGFYKKVVPYIENELLHKRINLDYYL